MPVLVRWSFYANDPFEGNRKRNAMRRLGNRKVLNLFPRSFGDFCSHEGVPNTIGLRASRAIRFELIYLSRSVTQRSGTSWQYVHI